MSSLSRLANSFISATNENTLALANFNFDFSLVKLEAPQEFVPLGSALSTDRRSNAEGGALHQLARKVGALFEQVIPSTPKLLKAYGCRASEIVEAPGVNPILKDPEMTVHSKASSESMVLLSGLLRHLVQLR